MGAGGCFVCAPHMQLLDGIPSLFSVSCHVVATQHPSRLPLALFLLERQRAGALLCVCAPSFGLPPPNELRSGKSEREERIELSIHTTTGDDPHAVPPSVYSRY